MITFQEKICLPNRKYDVLSIGELLVDVISSQYDDFTKGTFSAHFGGSPANLSLNLKKLGMNSIIAASVGKDAFGDSLVQRLKDNAISTKYINRVPEATSMVVITKSKSEPIPIFYRQADYQLKYSLDLEEAIKNTKVIHFSCWPISQNLSRKTIEKAITIAKENNVLIGFDPNYHESIWEKDSDGIAYIKQLIAKVDIVKPSETDAERIFGKDTPSNQIQKFINLGARLVIMTLGKDGAIISNGSSMYQIDSIATKVVDATGAGDAFWSGFYTGLLREYSILEAIKLGFIVSSISLTNVGAVTKLPNIEDIEKQYHLDDIKERVYENKK